VCASHVLAQMLPFSIRQAHKALSSALLQRGAAIRSGGTIARQLTSTRWQICFAQILLKKSKIEKSEESREGRFLVVYAAARLCRTDTCLLVRVNTKSEAHDSILANGYFGISLLRTGQEALARLFAGLDGVGGADRFRNAPWSEGVTGAPFLNTAICAIDCVLQQHQVVGSHGIFIGRIVATRQLCVGNPVINFQGELRTLPLACWNPNNDRSMFIKR